MNVRRFTSWPAPVRTIAVAITFVAVALPITAQTQGDAPSAMDIYRQDRADCLAGRTTQSQADCLYEARSALRDRRNGDPELNDANEAAGGDTTAAVAQSGEPVSADALPPRADRN